MEFLKQLPCLCGGAVLEDTKRCLSPDARPGDVLQEVHFKALGAEEHSVHNIRTDPVFSKIHRRGITSSAPTVLP